MHRATLISLTLLALTACGPDEDLEAAYAFADALPEAADLEFAVAGASVAARSAGAHDPFYSLTREVSGSINGFVGGWLDVIQTIVHTRPHRDGERFVWGPFHQGEGGLGPTTGYFVAQPHPDGGFSYQLIEAARADEDDPDAYLTLIEGRLLSGERVEDSTGYFAVDFDAALALDPARSTEGRAVIAYDFTGAHTADMGGGALVVAAMDGVGEVGQAPPLAAVYGYYRLPGGAGVMDIYAHDDVGGGADAELWDLRSRWTAGGEGRTDGQVTGGDLGAVVVTLSDCWEGYDTVYYEDDHGMNPTQGDEADCAFPEQSLPDGELPAWIRDALDGA